MSLSIFDLFSNINSESLINLKKFNLPHSLNFIPEKHFFIPQKNSFPKQIFNRKKFPIKIYEAFQILFFILVVRILIEQVAYYCRRHHNACFLTLFFP